MTAESRSLAHSQCYIDALAWAAELHHRQQRKGKRVPYICHLMPVSVLIWEDGGDEDAGITEGQITARFGRRGREGTLAAAQDPRHGARCPQ